MNKKIKIALLIGFIAPSLSSMAGNIEPESPRVKSIKQKNEHFKVKCKSKMSGVVSFEETNICAISKKSRKNKCDDEFNWTIQDAAEFICDGKIKKKAPLDNDMVEGS
ncbi:hypothetical protein CJF42_20700 [Pseudoalteromonas sp. NBT06-2]|uniref:hypothetical protein n=1 Tax=Pseudoalteromonas sp. NBT06-2 TaxID=2025950 RepID=UPI000BA62ED5|nr:hypothetical protein [Pseudoalteromonas sp. NBT06-2]PAJ72536.1 hypothetical protein CJF42_20700 [Pseudoalteromonas sp. NBT06-2]